MRALHEKMRYKRFVVAFLVAALVGPLAARADQTQPFAFGASVGPAAASRIDATVTRTVDGKPVTLPAAAVPALQPGDKISVRFLDYTRPPAKVNYHVNVAFITETPPVEWLYARSGTNDRLFTNPRGRRAARPAIKPMHFVYGSGDFRGIPVFFIVPEDGKTRGMDGVRDYVQAHPTDFKNMSVSSNDAVERYSWFSDFLSSLAQGAIDPVSDQQRVISIATALGASPDSVSACYTAGATNAEIANCVQSSLLAVQYQTDIEAPTQAQFFGGVASAATPVQLALYLEPLLAVWKIFSQDGHKEYEYLPTTLRLTKPVMPEAAPQQLLMGLKVPTLRPPAAYSSVLFFTIGDPDAVLSPPTVVSDDKGGGSCAASSRVEIPVHLSKTSQYVNDTTLTLTSASGAAIHVPIDPRTAAAPTIDRALLHPGEGYDVKLGGRFGFGPLRASQQAVAHIAVPGNASWKVETVAYHPALAGGTLDAIASSQAAPCLSGAELQMAGNTPIPLKIDHLDDRRVELTGPLAAIPAGTAHIHFFESDTAQHRRIADDATLAIAPTPAQVDAKKGQVAYIGDREILLTGDGFDGISGVRIGPNIYKKTPASNADSACFTGAPIGGGEIREGSVVTAELIPSAGGNGEAFALHLGGTRPELDTLGLTPAAPVHHAGDALTLDLASQTLPRRFQVRIRQAPQTATPCDALLDDATAVAVPPADVHRQSASDADVTFAAGDLLHDEAFGTLQVQIVDTVTKLASDWSNLAGQFAQ
ncbi:MAG TPA: hypothetical protein VMD07_07520 [Candidatus Acidoferrales bacterium]|nr:hypothetical protein [Candidatus Acidoferrales bacterium]